MPLGNPVRSRTEIDFPVTMIPARLDLRDNQPFWRRNIFAIPKTGVLGWLFSGRRARRRRYPWVVLGDPGGKRGANPFTVSRGSVDEVLHNVTDKLSIGTANGSEIVEVAFQHLFFVSGPGGVCESAAEKQLEERIAESLSSSLKGYIDPAVGVRVSCQVNPSLPAEQLNMYLGRGIFVPRQGERPIGWIRYYRDPSDRTSYSEPYLPDGRLAGLYKGQTAVVIGTGDGLLPAEIDFGAGGPTGSPFMFVSNATSGQPHEEDGGPGVNASLDFHQGQGNEPVPTRVSNASGESDIAWRIDFVAAAQLPGLLEVCVDARSSRLHWTATPQCNAAISSLLIDLGDLSLRGADRFWINLDRDNILTAYGLQVARLSFVWECRTGEMYVYEWDRSGTPFKTPGSAGLKCRVIDKDVIEIGRVDGRPFGYLALPDVPERAIFSDSFQSLRGYHLDWLDECGRIEFGETILSLGEAYAEKCSGTRISRFRPGETQKVIGPLVLTPLEPEVRRS